MAEERKRQRSDSSTSSTTATNGNGIKRQALDAKDGSAVPVSVPTTSSSSKQHMNDSTPSAVTTSSSAAATTTSHGLPATPTPAVTQAAAQTQEEKVPTIAMRALIVTQDASIIIGKGALCPSPIR